MALYNFSRLFVYAIVMYRHYANQTIMLYSIPVTPCTPEVHNLIAEITVRPEITVKKNAEQMT